MRQRALKPPPAPVINSSVSLPLLSVVVIVYNMRREAARTLRSLAADYQIGINPGDYEVLVVENGSTEPLDPADVRAHGANFHYLPVPEPTGSPAPAVNFGLRRARGESLAVMIDGARLASPGLLAAAVGAARLHPRAVVATASWHLGPSSQQHSVGNGYDHRREDALLAAIQWPDADNYRLFEVAAPARSAREGIFRTPGESNFLCLPRAVLLDEMGGCDERFDLPGGGLVNQDLFRRACELPDSELVLLLGEATFHQLHGGISTNPSAVAPDDIGARWQRQYHEIRGAPFSKSPRVPRLYGHVPPALARAAEWSAKLAADLHNTPDPATRAELVENALAYDAVNRTDAQQWLLLGGSVPDEPGSTGSTGDVSLPKLSRPAGRRPFLSRWLTHRRVARQKTLLFCVNYRKLQGAHLKTWHYFQHARASADWEPRVFFHPDTVWDQDNPWHDERARAEMDYAPEKADALFIDGLHNWLRLPAGKREDWPAPVLCTIQGFRHANPHKPYRDYLRCRAVRICVSEQVRAAIKGTGRVRGPTFVVPNAIDVPSVPAGGKPANDLFIAGLKNPEMAAAIGTRLSGMGWRVQANLTRTSRDEFLAGLRGAEMALFLPRAKEGFYLPALEAMALGVRVICPDVLGNRSFCTHGVNCLRPAYTEAALLAACLELRDQSGIERETMLTHARATAASHSLERERERFLRILDHLPALWRTRV